MDKNAKQIHLFKAITGKDFHIDFQGGKLSLDFDDTKDLIYDARQFCLFNVYYDSICYQPVHIYKGKSGKVVATRLRSGKRPTGKEIAKMSGVLYASSGKCGRMLTIWFAVIRTTTAPRSLIYVESLN